MLDNKTTGADQYLWTFEGGEPAGSNKKNPGEIIYSESGVFPIRLESWNHYHRDSKELTIRVDRAAILDFEPRIRINSFVPAEIEIINNTLGADSYEWFFEGGVPETSSEQVPPLIQYAHPGEYAIILKAVSGRKGYEMTKKITLFPELSVDFEIEPFFECVDMEAPWKAFVNNKSISALSYSWNAPGGRLKSSTETCTEIYYDNPGTYFLSLEAQNGKQTKTKTVEIVLKQNSNLQILENVNLGISDNKENGCFYSCRNRNVMKAEDVNTETGKTVDFIFFGLNQNFNYCLFISPDEAEEFVFSPIPEAIKTWFITILENSGISFSSTDFDAMKDDSALCQLPIKEKHTGNRYFNSSLCPRIVLFETSDGRKGAIKIKRFVSQGLDSYIEVDIKVQKEGKP
ncbi:MAG: hypothetical protein LBJ72_13370 [Dysgonamonadaceae bacterium]|nr:hypothetical protein [Dysgonamonadaceae bacterium]